jgi:hypothetical protein
VPLFLFLSSSVQLTTMKKIVLSLLVIALSLTVTAQKFQLGIKAGANFAAPKFTGTNITNVSGKTGLNIGAFATIGLLGINLQPELNYSAVNFDYTQTGVTPNVVHKFKQNYLAIPVLLKISIPLTGLGLYAGPQMSTLLSAKDNGADAKNGLEKKEWAAVFGADFKIPVVKIILSARYQAGITDMATSSNVKLKNNLTTFSIGYKF